MIYMVEMALLDTARRAEWEAWYVAHQKKLLAIPGIHASQRFETIHKADSPFVALHEVDSPDVFTSPAYRAQAGPTNTGEWQARMNNWHRNVFDGVGHTPDVSTDSRLLVVEADGGSALPGGVRVEWMTAVGLDQNVAKRGLAVVPDAVAHRFVGAPRVRVLKPLGPRLRSAS
jgi:hypothetical protein